MKTHNLSPKCEVTAGLHDKAATDSESYPNLVSSSETQLGEVVAVDGGIYNPPPVTSARTDNRCTRRRRNLVQQHDTLDNKGRDQTKRAAEKSKLQMKKDAYHHHPPIQTSY